MSVIPVAPVPNQMLSVQLGGQVCEIAIRQKSSGLYLTLWADDILIFSSILCLNAVPMTREYSSFAGNLMFVDLNGNSDPEYFGLGARYQLRFNP